MPDTQEDNIFIIAYPANLADIQAFVLGNETLLGRPLSAGGFLIDTSLLKARILGNTLAAVAYGIAIFLYFTCLGHLRSRPTRSQDFKRKWGPYVYITGMSGLSTATFLQSTIYATTSISLVRAEQIHGFVDTLMAYGSPFPILFIIWMAEGLMVSHSIQTEHGAQCTDLSRRSFAMRLACIGKFRQSRGTSYSSSSVLYFWFPWVNLSLHQMIACVLICRT